MFGRDLARVAVYQEIFDKSSFSGSDHGAKHIHNNIDNANKLHRHMDANDYSRKDKFLEHVIHFYHDIGYTTGMATRNFSASKDHPLIGAKIIEEQKPYFEKYLDAESYDILHKCVLYHAIAMPNLTHTEEKQGAHYEMIRAVTSISDACAVTYDRKTQEFWEQPQAVRALARLKFFLVQFPQYQASLSSDKIATNEWHGLNKDEPMDRMAHDVFQGVKQELRDLVNSADISEDKKDLFRQAIEQQFNGFTANVTLGQYGGVLTDVDVVVNPNGMARGGEGPKYQPKFVLAPSLVYGVLNDLFGADQANRAFKALCEEFGGDVKDIQGSLVSMAKAMQNKEAVQPRTVVTGNAVMEIAPNYEIDLDTHKHYKHLEEMQAGLARVTSELVDVYGSAEIGLEAKMNLFNQFQDVRKEKTPLDVFMRESIQPFMSMYTGARQEDTRALLQDPQFKQHMETIQKMDRELSQVPEKERTQKAREADLLYERLCGRIKLIILSDTELGFMAGTVHKEERVAVGG
ncbi:MAG: hypothetical protein LLG04_18340 [Parachlamydia sp.]|nr:hypothetical protein [Parachlamydia sp.]